MPLNKEKCENVKCKICLQACKNTAQLLQIVMCFKLDALPQAASKLICIFWNPHLDFQHKITVQASPSHDRRRSLLSSSSSPPTSPPMLPRLRAIQRKKHLTLNITMKYMIMMLMLKLLLSNLMYRFLKCVIVQSHQGRGAQPGVAARAFNKMKRS